MPPAVALTYGLAGPQDISGMTGRQMLEAMMAGKLPAPPISQTLGFGWSKSATANACSKVKPARTCSIRSAACTVAGR